MGLFCKQTERTSSEDIISMIQGNSHNLDSGLDPLLERIGDSRIVMLGEASHGTHEYYI